MSTVHRLICPDQWSPLLPPPWAQVSWMLGGSMTLLSPPLPETSCQTTLWLWSSPWLWPSSCVSYWPTSCAADERECTFLLYSSEIGWKPSNLQLLNIFTVWQLCITIHSCYITCFVFICSERRDGKTPEYVTFHSTYLNPLHETEDVLHHTIKEIKEDGQW